MPQRLYRIDPHGAASRNVSGEQGYDYQQYGNGRKHHRICRIHAKKQGGDQASEREQPGNANGHADEREFCPFSQHEPGDVPALRSERHADANFMCALRCCVSKHTVNANSCKKKRERCKETEQESIAFRLSNGGTDHLCHRADFRHGHLRIERMNLRH